jgi:non-heme chloroperoxidase
MLDMGFSEILVIFVLALVVLGPEKLPRLASQIGRWIGRARGMAAKTSEGVRESFWLQGMMTGFPAAYFCIKAFSETDQTEDLKRMEIPTLVIQGDDDQIVPFANAGALQAKLIPNAKLEVYKGAPHGLCTTMKDQVNEDLLAFIKA